MKKFFSLFLILSLFISVIPTYEVRAISGYTEISSAEEFNTAVRNNPSGKFMLTSDIILPSDFKPFSFSGEFIGDNEKELRLITLDIGPEDSANCHGLFSVITGSVKIKNIHIKGKVNGGDGDGVNYWGYTGGIAGVAEKLNQDAIIENCINSADINSFATYYSYAQGTGGIVGRDYNTRNKAPLTIKNCVNNGMISAEGTPTLNNGGIAGLSSAHIISCSNNGYVSGRRSVGGIVGNSEGAVIEKCYNTANVYTEFHYAGGIAGTTGFDGSHPAPALTIINCFNTGSAYGKLGFWGISGEISEKGSVTVSSSYTTAGLLAAEGTVISDSYFMDKISTSNSLTEEEMKSISSFKGFDEKIWEILPGFSYPQLKENPYKEYIADIEYPVVEFDYDSRFASSDSYDIRFEEEDYNAEDSKYENILKTTKVTVDARWENYHGAPSAGGEFKNAACALWFDENRYNSSSYLGGNGINAEIILNLSKNITFNKIVIPDCCRNSALFKVYVSSDKSSWQQIALWNKRGIFHKYLYFPTVTAKYIKFDVEEITDQTCGTYQGIQWMEIEIYNVDGNDDYRLERMVEIAKNTINSATDSDYYDPLRFSALSDETASAEIYLSGNGKTPVENEERKIRLEMLHTELLAHRIRPDSEYERILYNVKSGLCMTDSFMTPSQITGVAYNVSKIKSDVWKTMIKDGGEILWEDIGDSSYENLSGYVNKTPPSGLVMDRIYDMTYAATHKYSPLKGNENLLEDIYYALKIVNKYWVGTESQYHPLESWWRQIGFSYTYGRICAMLYDVTDKEKIQEIAQDFVDAQTPDYILYTISGYVQVASGMSCLGAILKRDDIVRAYPEIAFDNIIIKDDTESGKDGFYIDGSHIYHGGHPWIAGYGIQAVSHFTDTFDMFEGTSFVPDKERLKNFAEIIATESVFPMMAGILLPSVTNGRHMSSARSDYIAGQIVLISLTKLAYEILDEPLRTETLEKIKGKIKSYDSITPDVWKGWADNEVIRKLMEDESIKANDPIILKNKVYRFMDTVAHRRENYMMLLNMHSKRTATYEAAGGENKRGWYVRAGSTLFYEENDNYHYNDNYYVSFDAKRFPGVTAINCLDYDASSLSYNMVSDSAKQDFVGSVTLGEFGSSAYEADQFIYDANERTPRMARKSYFMFDDEVVMMGSDITNNINAFPTETTVDQRMIEEGDKDNIKINGNSLDTAFLEDTEYKGVKTLHLSGRNNSEFGYYFPGKTDLTVNKTKYERSGLETNSNDENVYTNTFATLYINHGNAPEKEKYVYAVLPGASEEKLAEYNINPDFEILMQTEDCHAVYEKTLDIVAINNYGETPVTIKGITVPERLCVICDFSGNEVKISVCDPTMKRKDTVEIILPDSSVRAVSSNGNISVSGNKVTANLKESYGDSLSLTFKKDLPDKLSDEMKIYTSINDSILGIKGFFILAYGKAEEFEGYILKEYGAEIILDNGRKEKLKSVFKKDSDGNYGILIHGSGITGGKTYEITPYAIYEKNGVIYER